MTPILTDNPLKDAIFIASLVLASGFSVLALASEGRGRILLLLVSSLGWFGIMADKISVNLSFVFLLANVLGFTGLFVSAKPGSGPFVRLGAALCAISIAGLPPFLGFWPKFVTVLSLSTAGYIWISALLVLSNLFAMLSLLKFLDGTSSKEGKAGFISYTVLASGGLSLVLGLFAKQVSSLFGAF